MMKLMGCVLLLALSSAPAAWSAGLGETCGVATACETGLWCDPTPGQCGKGPLSGTCVRVLARCHHNYHPNCGCNGVSYGNDCERGHDHVGERHFGHC